VNKSHGLRRTNDDKRRAVAATLEHELSKEWSSSRIAEHCGVNQDMVRRLRSTLAERRSDTGNLNLTEQSVDEGKVTGKDGKRYPAKKPKTKTTTSTTKTTKTTVETPKEEEFVEEHEEAKTPEVISDGLGRPVPKPFRRRKTRTLSAPASTGGFPPVDALPSAAYSAWESAGEVALSWVRRCSCSRANW
jgi:hypothetical protein